MSSLLTRTSFEGATGTSVPLRKLDDLDEKAVFLPIRPAPGPGPGAVFLDSGRCRGPHERHAHLPDTPASNPHSETGGERSLAPAPGRGPWRAPAFAFQGQGGTGCVPSVGTRRCVARKEERRQWRGRGPALSAACARSLLSGDREDRDGECLGFELTHRDQMPAGSAGRAGPGGHGARAPCPPLFPSRPTRSRRGRGSGP